MMVAWTMAVGMETEKSEIYSWKRTLAVMQENKGVIG